MYHLLRNLRNRVYYLLGYPIIHCSTQGCHNTLLAGEKIENPRRRWMLDMPVKDEDEKVLLLTLCDKCVKRYWDLQESDYKNLEDNEDFIEKGLQRK